MTARIYKPARNAMQSGTAKTRSWKLEYDQEKPREVEPLMGWTSSSDMKQQITLTFDTKEAAIAYCERNKLSYRVDEPQEAKRRLAAYSDNFSFKRLEPWSH